MCRREYVKLAFNNVNYPQLPGIGATFFAGPRRTKRQTPPNERTKQIYQKTAACKVAKCPPSVHRVCVCLGRKTYIVDRFVAYPPIVNAE